METVPHIIYLDEVMDPQEEKGRKGKKRSVRKREITY
jgi:hypothetical protein